MNGRPKVGLNLDEIGKLGAAHTNGLQAALSTQDALSDIKRRYTILTLMTTIHLYVYPLRWQVTWRTFIVQTR